MNKKYWITIVLDETLSDKELMNFIEKSHDNCE
jgi:predicted DNA-binding protein (MmcQ/YjbR family)